jgi:hypothetical protein
VYRREDRVFERLYNDREKREKRLEELRKHLEKLEEWHWEEVLTVFKLL